MTIQSDEKRPLITFALLAYNQERYIRDAIKGAFSQTYEPLEIIFSDDCSTDRTYQIIKQEAEGYSGRHAIVINQNESNMGIGAHLNRVVALSSGELIFLAAGDDISFPCRTKILTEAWVRSGKPTVCLHSDANAIDASGRDLGYTTGPWNSKALQDATQFLLRGACMLGATVAVPRTLFEYFGPLKVSGTETAEDIALSFRSALLGGSIYVNKPLVFYRVGTGVSTCRFEDLDRRARSARELSRLNQSISSTAMMASDVEKWNGNKERLMKLISKRRMVTECIKYSYISRVHTLRLAINIILDWIFDEKINLRPVAKAVFRVMTKRV